MKNPADTQTLELISTPKKRGRPSTGNARSAAERKRDQRCRDRLAVVAALCSDDRDFSELSTSALLQFFAESVSQGHAALARTMSKELIARAIENGQNAV